MPLKVLPVQLEDFDTLLQDSTRYELNDDLIPPPISFIWQVATPEDAQLRLNLYFTKLRRRFQQDSTAIFIKVVETKDGEDGEEEIISMARWHHYPLGYDYEAMYQWELAEQLPGQDWPVTFNHTMHDFFLTTRDRGRKDWIGVGKPVWILMGLVTRKSKRGKGAASLLIDWGVQKSEETGFPAFLESAPQALPLYEKHGFKVMVKRPFDLRPFGTNDVLLLPCMARYPQSAKMINGDKPKNNSEGDVSPNDESHS